MSRWAAQQPPDIENNANITGAAWRPFRDTRPLLQGLRDVSNYLVAGTIPSASTLALPIGACSSRKYATAEHNATTALIMNAVVNEPEYWMLNPVTIGATEPAR